MVAEVAHSQGGAVAHRALRHQRPSQVKLLLTFGSGLRKLEEIEQISKTDEGFFGRVYLTVAAVALIGYSAFSAFVWNSGWAASPTTSRLRTTASTAIRSAEKDSIECDAVYSKIRSMASAMS